MRKTKIVCTLGPATDSPEVLRELMINGMNVARINFSHGTLDEQKVRTDTFKKVRDSLNLPIAMMLDTKGPEVRTGCFKDGYTILEAGQSFRLTTDEIEGDNTRVSVTYKNLCREIHAGNKVLIDDGLIELCVVDVKKNDVICEVINGGKVSNRKSINFPGLSLAIPYMSEKDKNDIIFGIENDFDYIAASFVRSATDVLEVKKVLEENGGSDIHIIAKIENTDGVHNIDEIINVSDGIMVARGDMGVEIPFEELPSIQKDLIQKGYEAGKKVITATQMLESMTYNPRPTRAETTDVANAVYDGTSAIMLSGETAIGKYPIQSLETMSRIAESTENDINYKKRFELRYMKGSSSVTDAISHAACTTAHDLGAKAIVTVSRSGYTPRMISKFRPNCLIVATVITRRVWRQLALSWGIFPVMAEEQETTDNLFEHCVEKAIETGLVDNGDLIVITGGSPVGISGTTNILKVHLVGHVLVNGTGINKLSVSGNLCVAKNEEEAKRDFHEGDILVIPETSNGIIDILKKAKGIITEKDGITSHAAVVGITLDLPVVCGAAHATKILKSGTIVTIDANRGLVYSGVTKVL